jgi:phosphopantothenoylcysteine decarboxylase / phosphopantothenate---cysteine ligase
VTALSRRGRLRRTTAPAPRVSGGIAAYKAPELVRRLRDSGCEVRCALTRAAESFVAPLTLEVLSQHRVYTDDYLRPDGSGEEHHISAAQWAEALCVAPATADLLARPRPRPRRRFPDHHRPRSPGDVGRRARHASGDVGASRRSWSTCDCCAIAVPSWVGPVEGSLASGEVGWGRMVEIRKPSSRRSRASPPGGDLRGRTVVVSAGPTWEAVDAVRFLANRSSGKMGFAIAAAAARHGAEVHLVAGPVELPTRGRGAHRGGLHPVPALGNTADGRLRRGRPAGGADVHRRGPGRRRGPHREALRRPGGSAP